MSLIKYIERFKYMDYLIKTKSTGNAISFSNKLGISVSQLKENIADMRLLGANIFFDRSRNSYVYHDECGFIIKFMTNKDNRMAPPDDERLDLV
jgi:hypothetical protein